MSNPDDTLRLRHIRDYAREVRLFIQGKSRQSLDGDLLLERALCYNIGIVGEAASKLSAETRNLSPQIPWQKIVGTRNYLFHAYFKIDHDILWETATVSIVGLLDQIEAILLPDAPEIPDGDPNAGPSDNGETRTRL